MKITQWEAGNNPHEECGRMVVVTKKEAIQIIRSLSHQLEKLDADLDPNNVRIEFFPHNGGYFSIAINEDDDALFRGEKIGNINCTCDYAESGLCTECPGSEQMSRKEITLGGCYHSGVAYSLGYDANGVVELTGETFTNLNIGLNGGAMTALRKHRKQFDPSRDVEQFIVALKPVKVILGREDDEEYGLGNNTEYDNDSLDYDICGDCGEWIEDCCCDNRYGNDYCDRCNSNECLCDDNDDDCIRCGLDPDTCGCWDECDTEEFDQKNVAVTFRPMNAFARARWLKLQGKL